MKNKLYFLILFVMISQFSTLGFGQENTSVISKEKTYDVEIKNQDFLVNSAQLKSAFVKKDDEISEIFQLSFLVPFQFESLLPKSTVKITAYNEKGNVFGMSIWNSVSSNYLTRSDDNFAVKLGMDSEFKKANRFSLDLFQIKNENKDENCDSLGTSCPICVDLANETCGAGRVKSVKCGTIKDGSTCEFTCKD